MSKGLLVVSLFLASVSCPVPPPNPTPTPTPFPTPTPKPTPTPLPIVCSFPQGVPQEDFKLVPNPAEFSTIVDQTIRENTTCSGNTDCIWGNKDPQVYIKVMVEALRKKNLCVGQHTDNESDQISVSKSCNAGVTWENYQPVNFGGDFHKARFAPNNIRDGWQVPRSCTSTIPVPTPTPIPIQVCPSSIDKLNSKVRNQALWVVDFTPKTCDRNFCERVFPGNTCCDMGIEGTAQRSVCENLFGPYTATCPRLDCFPNDNPLQYKVRRSTTGGVLTLTSLSGVKGIASIPAN